MSFTQEQYEHIKHLLPKSRRKAEVDNLTFLQALHNMAENGCRWRLRKARLNVPKKQKKYYSGKKKHHTIKTQLPADAQTGLVLGVEQAEGSVGKALNPEITMKADSGYQGITAYHANSEIPYKKSKKHPLSQGEKAYNRQLSRERVLIEHMNRQIKIFKIMSERYRNRRRRHKLRMMLLCAIRNYEIIHNSG